MANERDRMTDERGSADDSMEGGMGESQGGSTGRRPDSESTDRSRDESNVEQVRGTGEDSDEDELEEDEDLEEEEEAGGDGTI